MNGEHLVGYFRKNSNWQAIEKILTQLNKNKFTAWLAGGCVRDGLIGRPISDFDVVTNASVDEVEKIFPRTVSVGKQFGVVRVQIDKHSIEVATFRKEGPYTDGRRPDSVEPATPEEDAFRRDFTINGLFFDPQTQTIIDFVGGIDDLKHNRLQTIGTASDRFSEDKLRILRALRFSAQLNFEISRETWAAIVKHHQEIAMVSAERSTEEMRKLIAAPFVSKGLTALYKARLASLIFPRVQRSFWDYAVEVISQPKQTNNLWGLAEFIALLSYAHDISFESRFLRLSNLEIKTRDQLWEDLKMLLHQPTWRVSDLLPILAGARGELALEMIYAQGLVETLKTDGRKTKTLDNCTWLRRQKELWLGASGDLPTPWFKGKDLMAMGFKSGPRLGQILKDLYDGQLNRRWPNRLQALKWLKSIG